MFPFPSPQAIHRIGQAASAEAVVDVDDGYAGSTAVEHGQEGRQAVEIGTISDTGRHGDDRFVDEAADDAGQSPFHAGDDDIYVGPADIIDAGQEAVDASDADVVDAFDAVAHDFRRQGRFFGKWGYRSSRR